MKLNLVIITLFCLITVGCNNTVHTKENNENNDVLDEQISNTPKVTDIEVEIGKVSAFLPKNDLSDNPETEKEALKGLVFGINEKEYNKIEPKLLANFEDEEVYGYHIGDFTFYNIKPYFFEGKLYRIDINGFNHSKIDDLKKEQDAIKNILNRNYGMPVFETKMPADKELNENTGKCIAEWKAGNKTIQLCFFDFTKVAHSNLLKLVIFQNDVAKAIDELEKKKRNEYSNANKDMI